MKNQTHHQKNTIIIDNFLPDDEFHSHQSFLLNKLDGKNVNVSWYSLHEDNVYRDICHKLLNLCSEYYNLSSCVGYEFWTQNNSLPGGWHYDKDESLYNQTGELSFPICSIIFYLNIQDLNDGKLHLEDTIITPKNNRVIIFPPGVYHFVEDFTGGRTSILVNPWDKFLYKDTESL